MKTFLRLVIFCFLVLDANAQVVLLDKVYDFVKQRDYAKAENAIALAEKNPATANDARTFYLKSFIYKELFLAERDRERKILFRTTAISSLRRSKALDRDGSLEHQVKELNDFISTSVYNDGIENYNREEYQLAIENFRSYLQLTSSGNTWLDANYFLGSCYYELNSLDSAEAYLNKVRLRNYDQPIVYSDLAYLYLKTGSKGQALEVIADGLQRYKDYFDLQIAELNVLSKFQMFDTLEQKAEKFLESNPDNLEVLLLTATTYEKNKKEEMKAKYFLKSESIYKRILAKDSTHFDGNYNLGVLYYNEAVDLVNTSSVETNVEELGKILDKSSRLFELALPRLLMIYDDKGSNLKLLQALQAIYYNLNMKTQLVEVNEKLKTLNQ